MQKFLYGIAALLALLIIIALALPATSRIEVSTRVDAHPGTVFALINDFRRVDLWAPWKAGDPNARIIYSGPPSGEGATVEWNGPIVGSGTQTIVESRPHEHVETVLNPGEPGEARTRFEIREEGAGSRVTWSFEHDYGFNLVGRYFGVLMRGVFRREYEDRLAELEILAESLPGADFRDLEIEHVDVEATDIAYLPTTARPEPTAISEAMGAAFFRILSFIDAQGLAEAGAPMSIARRFSGAELRFDAAIPVRGVTDETPRRDDGVRIGTSYGGPAVRASHVGPYRSLGETHRKLLSYLAALGFERAGDAWEAYVSDPARTDESELLTYVYYPVRPR